MKKIFLTLFILCFLPKFAHAAVRVNEIAWMGTTESEYGEWIEFYNDGDSDISLSDWKLYEAGGTTLIFTFSKTITAHGYLLLERVTASTPDPVPGINDEAGTFGGSGLSNSGENLVLKNSSGETIQTLDFSSGWPAGDSITKQTMQWTDTSWTTAVATPGAVTIGGDATSTTTQSGAGQSTTSQVVLQPHVDLVVPTIIYRGVPYEFVANFVSSTALSYMGYYTWNMGDGTYIKSVAGVDFQKKIDHTYIYPGLYTISFAYYPNPYEKKPQLISQKTIEIQIPAITMTILDTQAFQFKNETQKIIDISNWKLRYGEQVITLPDLTVLAAGASVVMSFKTLGIVPSNITSAIVETNGGMVIAEVGTTSKPKTVALFSAPIPTVFPATTEPKISSETLAAAAEPVSPTQIQNTPPSSNKHRTSTIVYGAVLIVIFGLFLLLERFMA